MKFITPEDTKELLDVNWKVQAIIRKYGLKEIVYKPNGEYEIRLNTSDIAPKEKQE